MPWIICTCRLVVIHLVDLHDFALLCMALHVFVCLYMTLYDFAWPCMNLHDFEWLCMTLHTIWHTPRFIKTSKFTVNIGFVKTLTGWLTGWLTDWLSVTPGPREASKKIRLVKFDLWECACMDRASIHSFTVLEWILIKF